MTPERWQQIDQLFHAALACEPSGRADFLAKACAGDEPLRLEVESLISSHEESDGFIETPAGDIAAGLLGAQESTFEPGQRIAYYRIVRHLGSGGMGEVYLADDIRLNRKIALKLLPPHFTVNPDRVRRFEREARAATALNHPNIVTIYEIGHSNSTHFIATEFVDGKTLRQLLDDKRLTLRETLNVGIQVAAALKGAHAAGIVHRDIKPENIMVRADGYVKILDFGLAKLTEQPPTEADLETPTLLQTNPGLVMGTVQYMSPEQARGRKVDVRTDIWSLGVVLYELLSGHVPFSGATSSHVMVSLMEDPSPSLAGYANVPADLAQIVSQALRKEIRERYQTAAQLMRDLKKLKQELEREEHLHGLLEAVPDTETRGVTAKDTQASASSLAGIAPKTGYALPIVLLSLLIGGGIGGYLFLKSRRSIQPKGPVQIATRNELIAIPGGTFEMGRFGGTKAEAPSHEVQVQAFEMDKTEVTNAEYGHFVTETNHLPPEHWAGVRPPVGQEMLPVSNVSYDDAVAFSEWRSRRDGLAYRLPTEEEWEYAARNGEQNNFYPWGDSWESKRAVTVEAAGKEQPVGSYPLGANRWGVLDLLGNVWEWTLSTYSMYKIDGQSREIPAEFKDWIIVRGGCYKSRSIAISSTTRDSFAHNYRHPGLGFRLVKASTP
jgi:serine/threonine protein kinase